MPSSNFLRSRWLPYLVVADVLGCVSPAIGGLLDFGDPATRGGLLYWWFMGLQVEAGLLFQPSAQFQYLLSAAVFTLQYLAVFTASALCVLALQRRRMRMARRSSSVPPQRQRAFEAAAAMYSTYDGS